jgi:hypothetical protein
MVKWIVGIFLVFMVVCATVYANTRAQYTELRINNPYSSISIKLQVKCDHNYKTGKYRYYKEVSIKRSSSIVMKVPTGLRKCEIWPIDKALFSDVK